MKKDTGHLIKTIYPGSIAEELGIEQGDVLLAINDKEIEDLEMKAKYYKKLYKIQNNPYFGKRLEYVKIK